MSIESNLSDPKLPALVLATDDEVMQQTLSALMAKKGVDGAIRPARVQHHVLKHTPGKRCVLAYRLESAEEPPQALWVIGKLYRADRGERIFERLVHLWDVLGGDGAEEGRLGMPEPLAYAPKLGMVLQTVVPGSPLSSLGDRDSWTGPLQWTAENLARLHALPATAGERRTMKEHVKRFCRPGPEALMAECPEMVSEVTRILARLTDGAIDEAERCVVHGDLGLAQVFTSDSRAFFVDFDGSCLAHPALDLANFMVSLEMRFGPASAPLEETFLARYRERRPAEAVQFLEAHRSLAYLRRAMIAFRSKTTPDWRTRAARLVALADRAWPPVASQAARHEEGR